MQTFKPFNLEEALAHPERVATKFNLKPVEQFTYFKNAGCEYVISAVS